MYMVTILIKPRCAYAQRELIVVCVCVCVCVFVCVCVCLCLSVCVSKSLPYLLYG